MKKTLTIGGNEITFVCSSVTPVFYKTEFKKDFFGDLIKMSKSMPKQNIDEMSYEDLDHVDFDIFSRLAFACYKTANPNTTKSYVQWLMANPEFSVTEHGDEITNLILSRFEPKKK